MKKDPTIFREVYLSLFSRRVILVLTSVCVVLSATVLNVSAESLSEMSMLQQATRITVTGNVFDAEGAPMIGVQVSEVGTGNTVLTGVRGEYMIRVASENSQIQFSIVGTMPMTERVGNRTVINVAMQPDAQAVEEVVVTAFGRQRKGSVVGSFQNVNVESLRVPTSSLTSGFAGQMAGVIAVTRSGEPGKTDGTQFWIRGISTFGAMKSPLIIIDGVQQSTADLNSYDPDMIESFSILKDATATALYGSRGANGVMIVTTKSGRTLDKPQISARVETSWSMPTSVPKFVDGVRYMELYNEAAASRGTGQVPYSDDKIYGTKIGANPYVFPNVDWYKEMFKSGALSESATFSVRGGSAKMDYFSSMSFNNETGILRKGKEFSFNSNLNVQRIVLQNNFNIAVTNTTKLSVKINANLRNYHGSHEDAATVFGRVMDSNPVDYPILYPSTGNFKVQAEGGLADPSDYDFLLWGGRGGGSWNQGYPNAYGQMVAGYKDDFQSTVIGSAELTQDLKFITEGLSASALFSFKNWSQTTTIRKYAGQPGYNRYIVGDYTWNADKTAIDSYVLSRIGSEISPIMEYSTPDNGAANGDRQIYMQGQINYDRTFGDKHNVTGMVVYTQEEQSANRPTTFIASLPKRKQGVAGRFTYAYDFRYLFEANFGYNGSENFAKGHRFGFFPSVGVGWVINRERWFEPLTNVVSNLKLRGSYGLVGNDSDATRFMYLSDITLSHADLRYTTGRNMNYSQDGPKYIRFGNENLTWEVGKKLNLGLDLGLLQNTLNISVDVFREDREKIFLTRQSVPDILGLSPTFPGPNNGTVDLSTQLYGNLGAVRNWGIDVSADYFKAFNKDFSVSFKGTFTFARNRVTAYDEPSFVQYPNLSRVGHSVDAIQMYVAERLFLDAAEVSGSPRQAIGGTVMAGDIKYTDMADANGVADGVINSSDRVWSKYPTVPEIIYGFGPTFRYKKWDFAFFFQGAANVQLMLSGFHPFGSNAPRNALQWIAEDYWSAESNPDIYAKYPRLSITDMANNTAASTYWLRNAAYLKLKNAELGYNHKTFRVYLRGTNLFTISPFKYWDPEQGNGNGLNQYPTQKVFNVGIQLMFK